MPLAFNGAFRQATSAPEWHVESDPNYRQVGSVDAVDLVLVDGSLPADHGWRLTFSNADTTPEGDRELYVEYRHPEPGLHVQSPVRYDVTLWAPRNAADTLLIAFERTAYVTVFRHIDRGKELVLVALPAQK